MKQRQQELEERRAKELKEWVYRIWIRGVEKSLSERELHEIFVDKCGTISEMNMEQSSAEKYGWIEFTSAEGAARALALDGTVVPECGAVALGVLDVAGRHRIEEEKRLERKRQLLQKSAPNAPAPAAGPVAPSVVPAPDSGPPGPAAPNPAAGPEPADQPSPVATDGATEDFAVALVELQPPPAPVPDNTGEPSVGAIDDEDPR
eukprot:TRINITY_DN12503_c0_g1_i1.p2 TRINITY_DN12503_c0_g1~~TRINITY_DN12503_c0_g1_i1.p2  ORF type:complete len:205 (+),score=47.85 TRINITY_DN12503_c0_g1_i1:1076-1690(+)